MKKYFCSIFAVIWLLTSVLSLAWAEESRDEQAEKMERAQTKWSALEREYEDQLSAPQRFVLHHIFDAIGYANMEKDQVLLDAIEACDSLEQLIALLGNGVFDSSDPLSNKKAIRDRAEDILKGIGYDIPECVFIQGVSGSYYGPEKHWSVFFGHYEERVYPNGDKMIEPMIDYSFVLYGEELQLVGFIAEQFASDEESEGFRVFP